MATITIRRLEEPLKAELRVRAARNGRSMEEEVREILRGALASSEPERLSFVQRIRQIVEPLGGIEIELPPREPMRPPPSFDE